MSKIRQILRFFTQGKSEVYISQRNEASHNKVKRYIHMSIGKDQRSSRLNYLSDNGTK